MYVGVILHPLPFLGWRNGIPHVCGGDPCHFLIAHLGDLVFPMYVGVIL